MKNSKSIMWGLFFLTLLAFSTVSCKKDEKKDTPAPQPVSSTEAKKNLESTSSTASTDVSDIANTPGTKAAVNVGKLNKDTALFSNRKARQIFNKFENLYNYAQANNNNTALRTVIGDSIFDFPKYCGTYTWNIAKKQWDINAKNPATSIVVSFPSDAGITVNDAILTWSKYTEIPVTVDGKMVYLPTGVYVDLKINSAVMAYIDFTATFNTPSPILNVVKTVNLTVYLKPYKWVTDFTNAGASVTANTSITKDGDAGPIVSVGGTVNFTDANKTKLKDVKQAYVQYRDLKLIGDANIETLMAIQGEPTPDQLNQNIKVDVLYKSAKQGIIFFANETVNGVTNMQVYIKFNDGTMEKAETYLKPTLDKITAEMNKIG